ncbi:MAG: DUF6168 family protein [Crocinitomicaceae bacterium]
MRIISIRFTLVLMTLTSLSWLLHNAIYDALGDEWSATNLYWEYGYNFGTSLLLGFFFSYVFVKHPDKLGFAFLGSISVKFILFFIFIYPEVRADDIISQVEFAGFFVPFSVCLLTELIFLVLLLRS